MPFKSPQAIAQAACESGCAKTRLTPARQFVLSILAGAYIGMAGLLAIVVGKGSPALAAANPGLAKLLFAAVFPVGLAMIVIAGAELFTGNTGVITPACLSGRARWQAMLRNWGVVYVGNFVGSVLVALFLGYWSGIIQGGELGAASAAMAEGKVALTWPQALLRGIGCNWLVCLAVWLVIGAEDVASKIVALWFPVMAFVAIGFEHSVANMFFIPLGMLNGAQVTVGQFLWNNLLPVTIGNIIGGAGFVGAVYWWVYARE